jgi:hypothetical protein
MEITVVTITHLISMESTNLKKRQSAKQPLVLRFVSCIQLKVNCMKKISLILIFIFSLLTGLKAQTMTGIFDQVPCNNDGIYSVSTTGLTPPITYTYYFANTTVTHSGVMSVTDQLTNIPMSNDGTIYCQATDGSSFAFSNDSYTPGFVFTTSTVSPICPVTMGTVTANQLSGTPGPFTFDWMHSLTLATYSGNGISVPVGEYSVTITDQLTGCVTEIGDSAISVQQLSNITATMSSTDASCTNGTATAIPSGGVAPYTYLWMNGATSSTITGLTQNYYTLTITDDQGCQSVGLGVYVDQNPIIAVNTTVTNATCIQSDGSAIAFGSGGVPPYSYVWSNGQTGNTATNLTGPDVYTVVATDANGCIGQGSAFVNSSTPITVTYSETPSQCTASTGSITLNPVGGTPPYTAEWNTFPITTGLTITNFPAGTYGFEVTDAVGCIRTGIAVISPISTINAMAGASTVICPATTGNVATSVSGTNPPFTYSWNTGATTSSLTGVSLGIYSCIITDAVGCSVTKSVSLNASSPLNVSVATTPVTCIFNTDGQAMATVTGGTAPYTYSYSNGTTTANATNLAMDDYWLSVSDANGCSSNPFHFWITNAALVDDCYCTISGNVYHDVSADCIYDMGEPGIENIMVHCTGFGYAFTDANGYYSFQVPTGTYTITEQVNGYYPLGTCQPIDETVSVVAASGCNTVVNIANDMNLISDLKLLTFNSTIPPLVGNVYYQKVVVTNMGTITESDVQLGYEHDGQLSYLASSLPAFVQSGAPEHYGVSAGYPSLTPGADQVMLLNYDTPTNIPIGTQVVFFDSVANMAPIQVNWLLDYSPWNNVNTYEQTVIAAYDPNYKEVNPKGLDAPGYISSATTEFDYTIHFQNEGSYFAQNIVITDQLDADLDWSTLTPGYSTHSYTTTVSETGLATFRFENIQLPWKDAFGDALSSGLVSYSIKRLDTTPQGTEFTNTADIYFDFNAPITTNTTLNTLNDAVFAGVEENVPVTEMEEGITMFVYPVPAEDFISIRVNNVSVEEVATISIMNVMGKTVLNEQVNLNEGSSIFTTPVSQLAPGNYFVKLQLENGSFEVRKIVVN